LIKKKEITGLSDEQLVFAFCEKGENEFLQELFSRHLRLVFLICMKYFKDEDQAKDMSMIVFEKVSEDIKKFEVRVFRNWLHVVTRNACLMELRKHTSAKTIHVAEEKEMEKIMESDTFLHPEDMNHHELKLTQLESAISSLEHEQKECIELFYLKEKSYKEVADITGYSVNQVKSNIQNGKRNLKIILVNKGDVFLFILVMIYYTLKL